MSTYSGPFANETSFLSPLPNKGLCRIPLAWNQLSAKPAPRFLVRHFILTVECCTSHLQSGSVKVTGRAPTVGPLHCMEVPCHLCT